MIHRLYLEIPSCSLLDLQTNYSFGDMLFMNDALEIKRDAEKEEANRVKAEMKNGN